jgi:hypothetical protein
VGVVRELVEYEDEDVRDQDEGERQKQRRGARVFSEKGAYV